MAGEDTPQPDGGWSQPRLRLELRWGEMEATVEEVSGIDLETLPIEYRHAGSTPFVSVKRPVSAMAHNVTLKKGVFKATNGFWQWFDGIKDGTVRRTTATILLLDEDDTALMSWTLKSASPVRVGAADPSADGETVSVHGIEISHQGIVTAHA